MTCGTRARRCYDQGVSIENIQDVLGHPSPTVTKTIYVDAAVDRLGFSSMSSGSGSRWGQGDQKAGLR